MKQLQYEVVVIGGGHAGCEAALAAARLGRKTCLVTLRVSHVGQMSCNPAIGGLGKSQIVREVDALGGEMARLADLTAIHFRRLNASKGPAVRARRVQCDIEAYRRRMHQSLEKCHNLVLVEALVERLVPAERGFIIEIRERQSIHANVVVVTTGTFLRGRLFTGQESKHGGREGDQASDNLSKCLECFGLHLRRFKTGTPPRLKSSTIDFSRLETQPSDEKVLPFSLHNSAPKNTDVVCHTTRTTQKTKEIIRKGLARSPLYTGKIQGLGPRYCPSIEDKVVRFAERKEHLVVLEPTTKKQEIVYPNGISTSLPADIQDEMVRSIPGLENAKIQQYGYAVEYDVIQSTELKHTLEHKKINGLFFAGQINGTSGYEEAAGQGLIAGINAARLVRKEPAFTIERQEGYIGVMIDDLVKKGTQEPYRMFSSRSEFRLLLREDNAIQRLWNKTKKLGLWERSELEKIEKQIEQVKALHEKLKHSIVVDTHSGKRISAEKMLRRPEIKIEQLSEIDQSLSSDVLEQVEVRVKYAGYIERQMREAKQMELQQSRRIPNDFCFEIPGISIELQQKLTQAKPQTMGEAMNIDGITPAALMILSIALGKKRK